MKFDVVVGTGSSRSVAALNSAKKGYKTLLIERGNLFFSNALGFYS